MGYWLLTLNLLFLITTVLLPALAFLTSFTVSSL